MLVLRTYHLLSFSCVCIKILNILKKKEHTKTMNNKYDKQAKEHTENDCKRHFKNYVFGETSIYHVHCYVNFFLANCLFIGS